MVRVSNILFGFLNGIILIIGLAVISTGLYFFVVGNSQCEKGIQTPLMVIGAALIVVSLLGLIGSCYRINFLLILYLFVMFLLIVALIYFTIFTIIVSSGASNNTFKHFKILNMKTWIREHFVNDKNWKEISSCLMDAKICQSFGDNNSNEINSDVKEFYKKNLSTIQAGCCKPPSECEFEYVNATYWKMAKAGPAVKNSDCRTWSNQQNTLCYKCESCKDGFVDNVRHKWKQFAIFNFCIIVFLIILYCVGCCAWKTNSQNKTYPKFKGYRAYP